MARRLNNRGKIAVGSLILIVIVTVVYFVIRLFSVDVVEVMISKVEEVGYLSPKTDYVASLNKMNYKFNDLNDVHISSASYNGIDPIDKINDFDTTKLQYRNAKELVAIKSCNYYVVGELTHSEPYLVPVAKILLDEIGERFDKKLKFYKLEHVRFSVNSLLRTVEHQKQLSRRNVNAAKESAHVYGTTFDISHKGFYNSKGMLVQNHKLKRLLIEAIGELKDEGRCFVKSENKQACYHITVIR